MPVAFPDILPVGTLVHSMLTEAQFQAETSSGWILADGRSVTGSRYAAITGATNAPDCQGRFLRARDAAGTTDPDGTVALGTQKASQNLSHEHQLRSTSVTSAGVGVDYPVITINSAQATDPGSSTNLPATEMPVVAAGASDARPLNIIVNVFIRIN